MKKILIAISAFLFCSNLFAQEKKVKLENVNVNSSEAVSASLPTNFVYAFDDFTQGMVYFKNGNIESGKLNYNYVAQEMQFIDADNQRLALANPEDVVYVIINKKVFYHISGNIFAEMLTPDDVKLCTIHSTRCTDIDNKNGAYGTSTRNVAANSYSQIYGTDLAVGSSKIENLAVNRDLTFTSTDEYVLEKNGKITRVRNLKSFVKVFPKYAKEINEYTSNHSLDMEKREDLIKLTNFCNQLSIVKK